jgi:hypothetical protein
MALYLGGRKYKIYLNKDSVQFLIPGFNPIIPPTPPEEDIYYLFSKDNYALTDRNNIYLLPKVNEFIGLASEDDYILQDSSGIYLVSNDEVILLLSSEDYALNDENGVYIIGKPSSKLRTSDGLKLTDSNQNYLIIKETN